MKGIKHKAVEFYMLANNYYGFDQSKSWLKNQVRFILASELIALDEFHEAVNYLELIDITSLDTISQKKLHHNIAICYLHLKDFGKAENNFEKSLMLKQQLQDTLGLAISYLDIANLYYNQYLDDKAIPLFEKGLEYAKLAKDDKVLRNAYLNMAVVEENRNGFKKALEYRKAYEKIVEDLWNRDKVWELAEQEKQFEVSLKEKEIALMEEQDKVQKAELQSRNTERNYSIAAAMLLLMVALVSTISYRKVRQSNQLISRQHNELEALNQTKNRLFSIVAHDLKSPVLALQKASHRLSAAIDAQDETHIRSIAAENERITGSTYGLLNNLLQWALDQSGQILITPEVIPATRLADQVLFDYEGVLLGKSIRLTQSVNPGHLILADLQTMKLVLRNLLDNAIKFTPEGGEITICSEEVSGKIRLSIRDTGCGISREHLKNLFGFSGKKQQPDTDGKTGTGLGLVLCKAMIERNQGELYVESSPGQSTTVALLLPQGQFS